MTVSAATAQPAVALEVKSVLKEKTIEGSHTPEEWLASLRPLAEHDRRGDTRRKILVGAAIAGFVITAAAWGISESALVGLPLLALTLAALGGYFLMRRQDLSNRLRDFVLPLLVVLREEMAPGQPVTLRLDLRGPEQPEKQTDIQKLDAGGYPKIEDSFYTDPWLTAEARLGDGARLVWEVVDDVRRRRVTRRNARGKVKTKIKYKTKMELAVRLGLPTDEYAPVAPLSEPETGDRLALKAGDRRHIVVVRRVVVARERQPQLDPQHFMDLVGAAYARVAPIRTEEHQR